ncbi:equilibrative nucleotide transporter 3-like protein [Cinnamomum micranthum f. kanehirae]|uniref:Equilibrative nucleotide transporter 3-like protein n=1 Tax=Cinnamomum micranthum f. kanehirae TaxID=337451 RepID=A0A443NE80_9MAGN|nr:equilibrative nucleotide transporter 3-like protein [Cinnamomum micranthum f. kanehirae]
MEKRGAKGEMVTSDGAAIEVQPQQVGGKRRGEEKRGVLGFFFFWFLGWVHWWEVAMTSNGEDVAIKGKYTAMFLCWVLGTGGLFPWNSLLASLDYYIAIFPDYHPSRVLTITGPSFAFGIITILTYNEAEMNNRLRNLIGFTIYVIGSVLVLVLNLATSGNGSIGAYIGMCAICVSLGVAEGFVQGAMGGDLSFMCQEFIQSFSAGAAASGTLASVLRLAIKAAFENTKGGLRKGALVFLAVTAFFELVCLLLYAYVFLKLPIIKYYHLKAAAEASKTVSNDLTATQIQVQANPSDGEDLERLSNKQLLLKNIDYAIDLVLIFMLTYSIFPGFLVEDTGSHGLGSWYPLVLTTVFNLGDLVSRYLPLINCLRITSRRGLMVATLARFLFIPAFYYTAKYGDQGWMIMLTFVLGLTNGYLVVCALMAAPKGYKGPEQNALGNMMQACLIGGILAGATFGWLWLIGKGW